MKEHLTRWSLIILTLMSIKLIKMFDIFLFNKTNVLVSWLVPLISRYLGEVSLKSQSYFIFEVICTPLL